jgi:hypothetical protein
MRRMKCDSKGCHLRGINHLYNQDNEIIGKYCDDCYSKVKSLYKNAIIKKYPKDNRNISQMLIREAEYAI